MFPVPCSTLEMRVWRQWAARADRWNWKQRQLRLTFKTSTSVSPLDWSPKQIPTSRPIPWSLSGRNAANVRRWDNSHIRRARTTHSQFLNYNPASSDCHSRSKCIHRRRRRRRRRKRRSSLRFLHPQRQHVVAAQFQPIAPRRHLIPCNVRSLLNTIPCCWQLITQK